MFYSEVKKKEEKMLLFLFAGYNLIEKFNRGRIKERMKVLVT